MRTKIYVKYSLRLNDDTVRQIDYEGYDELIKKVAEVVDNTLNKMDKEFKKEYGFDMDTSREVIFGYVEKLTGEELNYFESQMILNNLIEDIYLIEINTSRY